MNSRPYLKCWFLLTVVALLAANLRATVGFDTSSPLAYFTSVADKFLKSQPVLAASGLSVTNIPLYPTNCYTPSVQRLLQLAANIYDASTNKIAAPPFDFDYPSVFRPTFAVTIDDVSTNISINGYVEVTTNADYNLPAYSLPSDLGAFLSADPSNVNVYGVPWIIGAKRGFPNFNQVSMQSFTDISRKVQIVKPNYLLNHTTWHTNIQYIVGISNEIVVQAWNSYATDYTRATTIDCIDTVGMTLTNEYGALTNAIFLIGTGNLNSGIIVTDWAPYPTGNAQVNQSQVVASFKIPLYTTVSFMPDSVYHAATGSFTPVNSYTGSIPFDSTTGYPLPLFGLNVTNRLRFVMVDNASGRVIDYVQLDGMASQRNLTTELMGQPGTSDYGGDGGVWDTNRLTGTFNINDPLLGVIYQIQASMQNPPYQNQNFLPITAQDWANMLYPPPGFPNVSTAVQSFNDFYNNNTNRNPALSNQVPYTPTRSVSAYYTWQANDPLVHYTLSDLTGLGDLSTAPQTNYISTNMVLGGIQQVNRRYRPWWVSPNISSNDAYTFNLALKDPLITRSDDWNFPAGSLNYNSIGAVHRGTPWQTVYLKSTPVNFFNWQNWTGNAQTVPGSPFFSDAAITEPINDWNLVGLLIPLLNSQDVHQLASVNQSDFAGLLGDITVATNTEPTSYLTMVSNSPQATFIAAGITNIRTTEPGQLFHNIGNILAAPELTVNSPWFNGGDTSQLTDSDYELIPSQLLGLLRPDSIGSPAPASTNGTLLWQFTGLDGYSYLVEGSSNVLNWSPLATLTPTNGTFFFSEPAAFDHRFYRTSLAP